MMFLVAVIVIQVTMELCAINAKKAFLGTILDLVKVRFYTFRILRVELLAKGPISVPKMILACNCSITGADGIACNRDFQCTCKTNFRGLTCGTCALGSIGENCNVCADGYNKTQSGECVASKLSFDTTGCPNKFWQAQLG